MFQVISHTLASNLAASGTATLSYPSGYDRGDFVGGVDHRLVAFQKEWKAPSDFTLTFNAGDITLTWGAGQTTIPSGDILRVQLDQAGRNSTVVGGSSVDSTVNVSVVQIDLGSPAAADANGYVESQDLTSAGVFSVDTTATAAIASAALVGSADYARNVVAAWTGTAVLTVTGTDVYGNVVVESSASGTSLTGKKAFKTVTDVSSSGNITSLTVGTADVLGLPVFMPNGANVLKELENEAAATSGTIVSGVASVPSATTGDVRGTYDPNSACDGSKGFSLIAAIPDASYLGATQYSG